MYVFGRDLRSMSGPLRSMSRCGAVRRSLFVVLAGEVAVVLVLQGDLVG